MNAHQFAKLTQRQKLEHLVQTKRVTTREKTYVAGDDLKHGHIASLNGILIGDFHPTKEEALTEGKRILAKLKTEAQQLGIPVNQ